MNGTFVHLKPDVRAPYDIWKALKCREDYDEGTLISYGFPFDEVTSDDLRMETRLCYQQLADQMTHAELVAQSTRRSLVACSFGDVLRYTDQYRQLREFCCLMTNKRIAIASRNIRNQRMIQIRTMREDQMTSIFNAFMFLMKVN